MNKQTMTQYAVIVPNKMGSLAQVTQVLAKESVNIDCILTECHGDIATFRFVCDKECKKKLESAGMQVLEQQVLCVELPNRPGELNKLCKTLADRHVDIACLYGSAQGSMCKLVLSVDQPEKAAPVVQEAGASLVAA